MAKKDPTDLTVEEKLKTLYQLQTTLSSIDDKRALRGELPLEVHDLEDEIEGLHTHQNKIQDEIEDFKHAVAQKQGEIKEAETSVERYKQQLDTVANNREYDTLTKEIEFQILEIELCNKKIKEAQERVDAKNGELDATLKQIEDRTADLESKRAELDDIMQETRAEEEHLKDKAADLEKKIEPRLLTSFMRIRKGARNGLGIVYVQRDACGGCFNKIPPQRQLDIKMHKKIIVCEYCGRILVDPELAGVKLSSADVEEKPKRKRTIHRKKATDTEETAAE
jgi:predicted  nucleic acid-binding Zn-ribbon protein